jgi:phosphoribosylformylglycinamidine synthase
MESCLQRDLGFAIQKYNDFRVDAFLFGEGQGRIVVSVTEENVENFENYVSQTKIPLMRLGQVTSGDINVGETSFGNLREWKELYNNVLHTYLEN